MRSRIYLLLAIGTEVIGATPMKLTATHAPVVGTLLMYGVTGLFYSFLILVVRRVPVGVVYISWESIGIVLITAVSVAWLGESTGLYRAVDLGVMIAGILLTKSGARNASGTPAQPCGEAVAC